MNQTFAQAADVIAAYTAAGNQAAALDVEDGIRRVRAMGRPLAGVAAAGLDQTEHEQRDASARRWADARAYRERFDPRRLLKPRRRRW